MRRLPKIFLMIIALLAVVLVALVSCRTESEEPEAKGETQSITSEGVELMITTSSKTISSDAMLKVTMRVRHNPQCRMDLPEVTEKLGSFDVFDCQTLPARLSEDGWVEHQRIYTLEPDIPGDEELPSFKLKGEGPEGESIAIASKPIHVSVTSVLRKGDEKIRDIAPDERVEVLGRHARWPMALTLTNVLVVCCLMVLWRHWKKRREAGDMHGADAYQAFLQLADEGCPTMTSRLEPIVAQVIAQHHGWKLQAVDFEGLSDLLREYDVVVPELLDAIAHYNQLQYSAEPATDSEVSSVYSEFKRVVSGLIGKETHS